MAAVTAVLLVGCHSSSPDEGAVRPGDGVALNPGGKPTNEQEAAVASKMQETGNAMNSQRDKDAQAMADAKAKAGAK